MIKGILQGTNMSTIGFAITASQSQNGKTSFPVAPTNVIYSHFKHVSGVPAPDGVRGITVNRLKILDVLIDQLGQIKKRPDLSATGGNPLSDGQIDALIHLYEQQIRQARTVKAVMPYSVAPQMPAGMVFDLVA